MRVRSPKANNGGAWEYALRPPRGVDPLTVLAGCNEALVRWQEQRANGKPEADTPPAAPAPSRRR